MVQRLVDFTTRTGRRVGIAIAGSVVLLGGIAMIVLPGPALVVIPAGLAILALEFAWARRWLSILRTRSADAYARLRGKSHHARASDPIEP